METAAVVDTLVANHRAFLAFVEKRVGNRALAQEILQDALVKSLDKAELALRKSHLVEIRAQIDRERREGGVINVDADRMRAKLQAAANDTAMKMTLAARNAISDGDDDEEGLLEDLAELERDANQEKK